MFVGFFIPSAGYPACSTVGQTGCIPNVTNPWDELTKGLGYPSTAGAGGTITQTNTPENIKGTAVAQGCGIGGTIGFIGGVVAAGAVAILTDGVGLVGSTAIIGGATALGCGAGAVIGNTFPTQTTQLFNSVVAATGPFGQFLQALSLALQYAYPFIQFVIDWVPYSVGLLQYEPQGAAILFSFVTLTIITWVMWLAKLFRGTGSAG